MAQLECAIASLSRNFNDIHAWNAIKLYKRNANINTVGDVFEYLNRCETSYGGKVKIFLKPLNKHLNDFSRPLPRIHFGVSFFEQKYSTNSNRNYFLYFPGKKFMRRSMCYASGPWFCSSKF